MKKWIILGVILVLLILLIAYCNRPKTYPLSQPAESIVAIEIVEISDDRIISTANYDMITSCKVIDPAEHRAFLAAFEELRCRKSGNPPARYLEGKAIRFTYSDGAFELVGNASGFYCAANKDSKYVSYHFDDYAFYRFIKEHEQ